MLYALCVLGMGPVLLRITPACYCQLCPGTRPQRRHGEEGLHSLRAHPFVLSRDNSNHQPAMFSRALMWLAWAANPAVRRSRACNNRGPPHAWSFANASWWIVQKCVSRWLWARAFSLSHNCCTSSSFSSPSLLHINDASGD